MEVGPQVRCAAGLSLEPRPRLLIASLCFLSIRIRRITIPKTRELYLTIFSFLNLFLAFALVTYLICLILFVNSDSMHITSTSTFPHIQLVGLRLLIMTKHNNFCVLL